MATFQFRILINVTAFNIVKNWISKVSRVYQPHSLVFHLNLDAFSLVLHLLFFFLYLLVCSCFVCFFLVFFFQATRKLTLRNITAHPPKN